MSSIDSDTHGRGQKAQRMVSDGNETLSIEIRIAYEQKRAEDDQ